MLGFMEQAWNALDAKSANLKQPANTAQPPGNSNPPLLARIGGNSFFHIDAHLPWMAAIANS
jgi:hypothetical protein